MIFHVARNFSTVLLSLYLILPFALAGSPDYSTPMEFSGTNLNVLEGRAGKTATIEMYDRVDFNHEVFVILSGWPKDSDGTNNGLKIAVQNEIGATNLLSFTSTSTGSDSARIEMGVTGKDSSGNLIPFWSPQIETAVVNYSGNTIGRPTTKFPGV